MSFNPEYYHRRSIRLPGYNYSQAGVYFVTICTYKKQCLFGEVKEGKMLVNQIGKIVAEEWLNSARIRQELSLDEWIVMPNHIHGIVAIARDNSSDRNLENSGGAARSPIREGRNPPTKVDNDFCWGV